jgi:hypothetical protein
MSPPQTVRPPRQAWAVDVLGLDLEKPALATSLAQRQRPDYASPPLQETWGRMFLVGHGIRRWLRPHIWQSCQPSGSAPSSPPAAATDIAHTAANRLTVRPPPIPRASASSISRSGVLWGSAISASSVQGRDGSRQRLLCEDHPSILDIALRSERDFCHSSFRKHNRRSDNIPASRSSAVGQTSDSSSDSGSRGPNAQ